MVVSPTNAELKSYGFDLKFDHNKKEQAVITGSTKLYERMFVLDIVELVMFFIKNYPLSWEG
jgi:hypothetical protein